MELINTILISFLYLFFWVQVFMFVRQSLFKALIYGTVTYLGCVALLFVLNSLEPNLALNGILFYISLIVLPITFFYQFYFFLANNYEYRMNYKEGKLERRDYYAFYVLLGLFVGYFFLLGLFMFSWNLSD